MKPSDLFGIVVRSIGVWFIAVGLSSIGSADNGIVFAINVAAHIVVGGALLFGATTIARITYRDQR